MRIGAVSAVAAGLLCACAGCGGKTSDREKLVQALQKESVGVCDGGCTTFAARDATCAHDGRRLEGRTFYRCRVSYKPSGGGDAPVPRPDVFCAALGGGPGGYTVRPRSSC